MQDNVVQLLSAVVLASALVAGVYLTIKGSTTAKYFMWTWAALMAVAAPLSLVLETGLLSSVAAGVLLVCFMLTIYLVNKNNLELLELSHEETRRVLAESNNRIEDERRLISRRIHDDINPNLLLCRNELQRIQPLVKDNEKVASIIASVAGMLADTYKTTRELIRNTRIEVIDSIGFTAATESLVAHYNSCIEKPELLLTHTLPPKPAMAQQVALNAYKIMREAMFNAIKHANAKQVVITINYSVDIDGYRISVADDGIGLEATRQDVADGIGLLDMRERARAIGATLVIKAANPTSLRRPGTQVSLEFSGNPG